MTTGVGRVGVADQALVQAPSPAVSAASGFDPSRFEYRFSIRDGRERHDWIVSGKYGAINIWAEPSSPGFGERWYGGIEGHSKTPREYDNAEKPSQDLCWLLLTPCWHDGSSLQFSEQVEAGLPPPTGKAMAGHVLEGLKSLLRSRYRSWLADEAIATEARRAETSSGSVHEGAGPQDIAQTPSGSDQ